MLVIKEQKKLLREKIIHKRDSLDSNYLNEKSRVIFEKAIASDCLKKASLVLCYKSFGSEVVTDDIFNYCFEHGKNIAVPFCKEHSLEFRLVKSENDFTYGKFGIITACDYCRTVNVFSDTVCITPALAVDRNNFRLGYGGGYYDRFLSQHNDVISVGICFSDFVFEELPVDSHDMRLNRCITDTFILGGVEDGRR